MIPLTTFEVVAVLLVVLFYLYLLYRRRRNVKPKPASIMQPARTDLDPPKDDVFTVEQLRAFDGSREGFPLLVSIKGTVFDVSRKKDVYGPGKSYGVFTGRDASRAFGMTSTKPEDAVSDCSTLTEKQLKVLDDWHRFFTKRYNIVGRLVDTATS